MTRLSRLVAAQRRVIQRLLPVNPVFARMSDARLRATRARLAVAQAKGTMVRVMEGFV